MSKKMDMRFGTWNVRSLYRAGALGLATSEIDKHKIDLVGVQEVRWEGSDTLESGKYTLFYGEGNASLQLGTGFFVHRRNRSAVKKMEFISDRVSCITLKGRWYDNIVLNVYMPQQKIRTTILKTAFMKK